VAVRYEVRARQRNNGRNLVERFATLDEAIAHARTFVAKNPALQSFDVEVRDLRKDVPEQVVWTPQTAREGSR
jgi:hypothetical protein